MSQSVRDLATIREVIEERNKWALADQNRDSRMFLRILDELASHIQRLEARLAADRTQKEPK